MRHNNVVAGTRSHVKRLMPVVMLPVLFLLLVSLACAGPPSKLDLAITEATHKAERIEAGIKATDMATIVNATGTAIAGGVLAEMPQELQPLHERFGLLFVRVPAQVAPNPTRTPTPTPTVSPTPSRWADNPTPTPMPMIVYEYWMGLTEVTNAQYRPFVEAGGYEDRSLWSDAAWKSRHEEGSVYSYSGPGCWNDPVFNAPNQPIACVSWDEATAYAKWLSRETGLVVRLPTEAEWMRAARGDDARIYPWGDEPPSPTLANYDSVWGAPAPVGIFFAGASPYGALDMSGNIWEWTSTPFLELTPVPYDKSGSFYVKGGTWSESTYYLPIDHNIFFARERQMNFVGFRLLVTVSP